MFAFPNVLAESNANLSGSQRYTLLWMNCLGIGGRRVQELMRHVLIVDGHGNESALLPVIPPYKRSSSCPVPKDETALIANARRRSPKVVKSSAVKEKESTSRSD